MFFIYYYKKMGNNKKYEIEKIWDNMVYAKKLENFYKNSIF